MKDARGHGSNSFGKRTAQPSVSNVQAVAELMHAMKPPVHSAGTDLVRNMRGSQRGDRMFSDNPINFSYLKGRHR